MICPICKNNMVVVEYDKIELDYCTNCYGMWFDAGELELLLGLLGLGNEHDFLRNIYDAPSVKCDEKKRQCPICLRRMIKRYIGGRAELLIDVCRHGHGLWFDGGELNILIKTVTNISPPQGDSQYHVLSFISDVFRSKD